MRKEKKHTKHSVILVLLLTVFFVSFLGSAFIIINANKLVFVDNYNQYKAIMDNMESEDNKDAKIVDLEEQVERYKGLYESVSEENRALIAANNELNKKLNSTSSKPSSDATVKPSVNNNENSTDNKKPPVDEQKDTVSEDNRNQENDDKVTDKENETTLENKDEETKEILGTEE